jgi:group I intron endonuclease
MKPTELTINPIVSINKPGIYMIYNQENKKAYIGQASHIRKRFNSHKSELKNGCHGNSYLQNAWNKYGENTFLFIPLENCAKKELTNREAYYLDLIDLELRYNLKVVTEVHVTSEVTREKIRQANLGRKASEETRKKMSESAKKVIHSPLSEEHKQNLSLAHKGKALSEEHKQKIAESQSRSIKITNSILSTTMCRQTAKDFSYNSEDKSLNIFIIFHI